MPAPKDKGECTVKIGNTELQLRFKSKNLRVLSEILNGESPFEFLTRFSSSDPQTAVLKFANPAFILPAIAAGCAHHPEYKHQSVDVLLENLENLIDKAVDSSDKSPAEVYLMIGSQVMFPLIASIQGVDEFGGKPVGELVKDLVKSLGGEK